MEERDKRNVLLICRIVLTNFQKPPRLCKSLLNGDHSKSNHFFYNNIRLHKSAFQLTAFGAKGITEGPFMPTNKVQSQGQISPKSKRNCIVFDKDTNDVSRAQLVLFMRQRFLFVLFSKVDYKYFC